MADHGEVKRRAHVTQLCAGLNQQHLALGRRQAPYADELCHRGLRGMGNGTENAGIHAQSTDRELGPVRWCADAHELAARELADADNAVRCMHLEGQLLSWHVVKFVRAVNGVGQMAAGQRLHQYAHAGARIPEMHMQVRQCQALHPARHHRRLDGIGQAFDQAKTAGGTPGARSVASMRSRLRSGALMDAV